MKIKKFVAIIILACCITLGIIALACMAGPGIKFEDSFFGQKFVETISSFKLMNDNNSAKVTAGFAFILLFALITICGSIGLLVMKLLNVKKISAFVAFGVAGIAFISAILFFCTKAITFADTPSEADLSAYKLGAGAIVSGLFMLLNAGGLAFYGVTELKNK